MCSYETIEHHSNERLLLDTISSCKLMFDKCVECTSSSCEAHRGIFMIVISGMNGRRLSTLRIPRVITDFPCTCVGPLPCRRNLSSTRRSCGLSSTRCSCGLLGPPTCDIDGMTVNRNIWNKFFFSL